MEQSLRDEYANAQPLSDMFRGPSGHSLLPGGYGRSMFAIDPRTPMAVRGCGCYLRDDAGRKLIDLNNNFTANIHGNAHPELVEAAEKAVRHGFSFGLPNMLEIEHARLMLTRLRYVDQIRYTNSGTEAVMLAVRVVRAATGRDKVVLVQHAYHGHSDIALIAGGPGSRRGVPAGVANDTIEVAVNDLRGLTEAFDRHRGEIAAVLVDPLPNRSGLIPISTAFLRAARTLCTESGAALVSDEVISLRLAYEGAMMAAGVEPDLITVGKIIGGGTPVGAIAGRAELMSELDSLHGGLEHGGTTSGNPVTMAAGLASMRLLTSAEIDRLNALGTRIRSALGVAVDQHGWEVRGAGSLLRLFPKDASREQTREAQIALWWAAYSRGVLLGQNTMGALSTPMTESIVDDVTARITDAVVVTSRLATSTV